MAQAICVSIHPSRPGGAPSSTFLRPWRSSHALWQCRHAHANLVPHGTSDSIFGAALQPASEGWRRWDYSAIHGFASQQLVTRPAIEADAYPAADLHVQAFYPRVWKPLRRLLVLDRILATKIGHSFDAKGGGGTFCMFVADTRPQEMATRREEPFAGSGLQGVLPAGGFIQQLQKAMLKQALEALAWQDAEQWWDIPYTERGLVGAVACDTLGFHIPAEQLPSGEWKRRHNIAYISNLVVAPGARRQGIASKLVRRCEDAARGVDGVEALALHVDAHNGAGRALYASCGFEEIVKGQDSKWESLLGLGNGPPGLVLMVKDI